VDALSDVFLVNLGFLGNNGGLTSIGSEYFQAKFIRGDVLHASHIVKNALLGIKPVMAICQNLFGVSSASKESAASLLRFHGLDDNMSERTLGTLLTMLSKFGIITYYRGSITIIDAPMQQQVLPNSIFISDKTPYSNKAWLRKVIADADSFVYWFDKHFLPTALESIWEVVDGNQINEIRILSLKLEGNSGKIARKQCRDLEVELANRGIVLDWRFIDSNDVRRTHDRWIICKTKAWNVPDVGTILSGNNSEISQSLHCKELKKIFENYWAKGKSMINV
jgi:hypothetical protein